MSWVKTWHWSADGRSRPEAGGAASAREAPPPEPAAGPITARARTAGTFAAYMVTCEQRRAMCARTLASFRATDWGCDPQLQVDDGAEAHELARIHANWLKALSRVAAGDADFALVMEDDLDFNVHLRHNLTTWVPLCDRDGGTPFFGSIYNAGRPVAWRPANQPYFVAVGAFAWGAQAVVMSRFMASYFLRHWKEVEGAADVRMPILAERLSPVFFHSPSLVQHVGAGNSTWHGRFHQAADFDPLWRAPVEVGA